MSSRVINCVQMIDRPAEEIRGPIDRLEQGHYPWYQRCCSPVGSPGRRGTTWPVGAPQRPGRRRRWAMPTPCGGIPGIPLFALRTHHLRRFARGEQRLPSAGEPPGRARPHAMVR